MACPNVRATVRIAPARPPDMIYRLQGMCLAVLSASAQGGTSATVPDPPVSA